jgi:hypothetical protein
MTNFTEQLHTAGNEIRMNRAERSRVHMALRAKMQESEKSPFSIPSPFMTVLPRAVVAFALIVVISGGTAYAAEGSLPGDPLYAVKVDALEPIEGSLQFGDSAKAAWNAKIANRRLDEAQSLAAEGRLTEAASDELAANFTAHANAVTAAAAHISVADPVSAADISGDFSTSVANRGATILAASKKSANASSAKASGSLVVSIANDEENAGNLPVATSANTLMKASGGVVGNSGDATRLSNQAHAALSAARNTIAQSNLSRSETSQARARAASIGTRIVKADAELSIGSTSEAVADFNRALSDLDSLTSTLSATSGFHTNVAPSVNLHL